jgi:RecA/RadA recombinase
MTLVDRLPFLLSREPNIRLIIIDSLAALFRSEDIMFEHQMKATTLQYFGFAMHTLCHRYNIAIVCVNQVHSIIILSTRKSFFLSFDIGANSI